MEGIKTFIKEHKKEIICVGCGLLIYRMGHRAGYRSSMKAMHEIIKECAQALEIRHF